MPLGVARAAIISSRALSVSFVSAAGAQATASTTVTITSFTVPSESGLLLILAAAAEDAEGQATASMVPTGVSWAPGSQAFTIVSGSEQRIGAGAAVSNAIKGFYLLNPSAGTGNIVATWDNTNNTAQGAVVMLFRRVNVSAPIAFSSGLTDTTEPLNLTGDLAHARNMLATFCSCSDSGTMSASPGDLRHDQAMSTNAKLGASTLQGAEYTTPNTYDIAWGVSGTTARWVAFKAELARIS